MQNKEIIIFVREAFNRQYRNIIYPNKFYKKIFANKYSIINDYLKNSKIKLKINPKNKKIKKNKIETEFFLKNLIVKKIIKKKEKLQLFNFYKKFSVHLKLNKQYDKNLISIKKSEVELKCYIYLGQLVKKIPYTNDIQKLNFLIKVNEKILINISKIKDKNLLILFAQNLKFEINLINKFI
jgi:hypothetical protein